MAPRRGAFGTAGRGGALAVHLLDALERHRLARGGWVEDHQARHVHVGRRRLEVEEGGVEAGQSLCHGSMMLNRGSGCSRSAEEAPERPGVAVDRQLAVLDRGGDRRGSASTFVRVVRSIVRVASTSSIAGHELRALCSSRNVHSWSMSGSATRWRAARRRPQVRRAAPPAGRTPCRRSRPGAGRRPGGFRDPTVPSARFGGAPAPRQVEVAPRSRFGLEPELLEGRRLEPAPRRSGLGEDDVVHDLGDPAVVAGVEVLPRPFQDRIGPTHVLDVAHRRRLGAAGGGSPGCRRTSRGSAGTRPWRCG